MKAVGYFVAGGPEVLEIIELPDPVAGPGEILIRVQAAAVNPTDTLSRAGSRLEGPPPYVVGMDAAGVVEAIGDNTTTELHVGDAVMAIVCPSGPYGAYSELVVVPAESAVRVPKGHSVIEASTLPMNALTSRKALDLLDLPAGSTLAVTGGAGIVGRYAIQLAKADGLRVIADAAPADEALVSSVGADIVVRRGPDLAQRIREVVPEGVDGIVDAALMNELIVPAVKDGGKIASVRGFVGDESRGVSFYPVGVRTYAREHAKLDRMREQVEQGAITLLVARTFPKEQATEAHQLLEAGGTRGRIVLLF